MGAGPKTVVTALVAVAIGLGVGALLWAGDDGGRDKPIADSSAPGGGDLFVVEGRPDAARSNGDGTIAVSLANASVLWFSDRPVRLKGTRPIGPFVEGWTTTFGADPPNAAVLAVTGRGARLPPHVVELGTPRFDSATGVAAFELKPEGGPDGARGTSLQRLIPRRGSGADRIAFFIDNSLLPEPAPAPDPAVVAAAAFAQAEQAVATLQELAGTGGQTGPTAAQDLQEIQRDAAAGQ